MTTTKHLAWDLGAIESAFIEALGFSPAQKTTKTYCGKRAIAMAAIDNTAPTCSACIAKKAEDDAMHARLMAEISILESSLGVR